MLTDKTIILIAYCRPTSNLLGSFIEWHEILVNSVSHRKRLQSDFGSNFYNFKIGPLSAVPLCSILAATTYELDNGKNSGSLVIKFNIQTIVLFICRQLIGKKLPLCDFVGLCIDY